MKQSDKTPNWLQQSKIYGYRLQVPYNSVLMTHFETQNKIQKLGVRHLDG